MLTPISGAYGSEPSLVRGDVSLREEGVNANRKRINTPVHAQAKALSSKAPGNKASVEKYLIYKYITFNPIEKR